MLFEGLKLMGVGMTTVMLFLIFLILCIEFVRHLNRNFIEAEETSIKDVQESQKKPVKSNPIKKLPIEVFAAAITAFESENNNY